MVRASHAAAATATLDTRTQLLAVARDLYLEEGPAHFSLREVARRVGVSPAAVYRHFDDKAALVDAACTQGFDVFSGYLVRALEAPTPLARLLATGEQYRLFALENAMDYRFIFMSPRTHDGHQGAKKLASKGAGGELGPQGATFRLLVDRVKECMVAGILAHGDPDEVAVLIWAHVHGLVSLRLSGNLDSIGDENAFAMFYEASVARLLAGLKP